MEEGKVSFTLRLSEDGYNNCKAGMVIDNCLSRNEYIEKAIAFYSGYLTTQHNTDYFSQVICTCVESSVKTTENRIARLIFKVAVELAKLEQMLAVINEMDEESIRKLHIRCVNEVKKINGILGMEEAMRFQKWEKD